MKTNIGKRDKIIRIVLAIIIAEAGFYYSSWWGLAALVPLLTAISGICPLYLLFGLDTSKTRASVH